MAETEALDGFLYFAFGSNMNGKRLALSCPEARSVGPALLNDYTLDFWSLKSGIDGAWHGATATIVKKTGNEVWGVLWRIPKTLLNALDR